MTTLNKLDARIGDQFVPHEYRDTYSIEQTTGPQRLCIAASRRHCDLLLSLAREFQGPFSLLVVLHVPRVGDAGRYESPPLDYEEVERFVNEFGSFLENDARHDFWIIAHEEGLLVYDQHNLIFAYGPLDRLERVLIVEGLSAGEVAVPVPHGHRFHSEFDGAERRLLQYFDWVRSELQPHDGE